MSTEDRPEGTPRMTADHAWWLHHEAQFAGGEDENEEKVRCLHEAAAFIEAHLAAPAPKRRRRATRTFARTAGIVGAPTVGRDTGGGTRGAPSEHLANVPSRSWPSATA